MNDHVKESRGRVKVTNIKKSFSDGNRKNTPLKNITFSLEPGSFTAVMGRSGSGKSTLLSILGAMDVPDAGEYFLDDKNLTTASRAQQTVYRRDDIGFVFQNHNLIAGLTALENVMLPLEFSGWSAKDRKKKANELLLEVGLGEDRQTRRTNRLSGGEQQRVGLARSLANQPRLLLADEPTGSLDEENASAVIDLLRNTSKDRGTTVIMVTHDSSMANHADAIYRLRNGSLHKA